MKQFLWLSLFVALPFVQAQKDTGFVWEEKLASGRDIAADPSGGVRAAGWLISLPAGAPDEVINQAAVVFRVTSEQADEVTGLNLANNYAAFLGKQGRFEQAAALLKETWAKTPLDQVLSPDQAARCYYNYARALMGQQRYKPALEFLGKAIEGDADFVQAKTAVLEIVFASKGRVGLSHAMGLAEAAVGQGRTRFAQTFLRDCLDQQPEVLTRLITERYMSTWLDLLVATRCKPKTYTKLWLPAFRNALASLDKTEVLADVTSTTELAGSPAWNLFRVIHQTFSGQARPGLETVLPGTYKQKIGAFLNLQGRYRIKNKKLEVAVSLLQLSWKVDPTNMEAGLLLSSLLIDHSEQIDRDGRILDSLISTLFRGKGMAYRSKDWPAIYNFHCLLGTIFQKRKIWGNSEREVRSALGQWYLGKKAHGRLLREDPSRSKQIPLLYRNLGIAYKGAGKKEDAWDALTTSSEQYADLKQTTFSRQAFTTRAELGFQPRENEAVARDRALVARLFTPQGHNPESNNVAILVARQVEWSASGGKIGRQADFSEVDMSSYDFRGLNLSGSNFTGAKLSLAKFDGSNLTNVNFKSADLTGAQISKAQLSGVDFSDAKLEGVTLKSDIKQLKTPLPKQYILKDNLLKTVIEKNLEIREQNQQ